MKDTDKDYRYFPLGEWCYLLSTIEVEYNRNRARDQNKRHGASTPALNDSDRDTSTKVSRKKKARTGVLTY